MADQREEVAGVFDRAAEDYDHVGVEFFTTVGATLVEETGVVAGAHVVDLGCGRGAATFPAAVAAGPTGSVLGLDLAPRMVELTAEDAVTRGLGTVEVRVGDAQEPELPAASFDVALSSLVVFFLPDPLAALRAWRAALRPGGRLGLSTFADRDDERWSWLEDLFPSRDPRSTRPDGDEDDSPFATDARLHRLLTDAGFREPASRTVEHVVRFARPDEWLAWSWSTGMRAHWERTPESQRPDVERQALRELDRMAAEADGLQLRMSVRYTTASR